MGPRDLTTVLLLLLLVPSSRGQPPPLDYPWDDYDPMAALRLNSSTCRERGTCEGGMTFPDKNCHCDVLCHVMNDCCENAASVNISTTKGQLTCKQVPGLVKNAYGVLLVVHCSDEWTDDQTRNLCENASLAGDYSVDGDLILQTPVSDNTPANIMYQNMYCAYCNNVNEFKFWNPQYECMNNKTDVRHIPGSPDCKLVFTRPEFDAKFRQCDLMPAISNCLSDSDAELVVKCDTEPHYLVYDSIGHVYRNSFCAQCNGVSTEDMYCETLDLEPAPTDDPNARKASFRLLVDFNHYTAYKNDELFDEQITCGEDQIYDVVSSKCRYIYCPPHTKAMKGRCQTDNETLTATLDLNNNCTWVKLDSSEYKFIDDSRLFILSSQKVYNETEYMRNASDVFICHTDEHVCLENCGSRDVAFDFDDVEAYLSLAGLIISITALAVTFVAYTCLPQLLNTPGRILVCLVLSLLLAQLGFLVSGELAVRTDACRALAVLVHYFFMAAFCWMNVIAFDLWKTFSNKFATSGSGSAIKKLGYYSLYAWLTPLVIVCIAVTLDFGDFTIKYPSLKPRYGERACWISSRDSLIVFFLGPLALCKLFDITSFVFTAVHIARANKQGAVARRKKNTCSLLINIKLSLVMGLTWVFAFLANVTNVAPMWYLFIIFNTLQGLFIAVSFLCTRKVGRLVQEKYEVVTSSFSSRTSTANTASSSLSKDSQK